MALHPFHSKMHSAHGDVLLVKVARAIGSAGEFGTLDTQMEQWLVPMVEWSAILETRKTAMFHKGHLPQDIDWLKRVEKLTATVDLRTCFDVRRQCVRVPYVTWRSISGLREELQCCGDRDGLRRVWIIETMIDMGIKPAMTAMGLDPEA